MILRKNISLALFALLALGAANYSYCADGEAAAAELRDAAEKAKLDADAADRKADAADKNAAAADKNAAAADKKADAADKEADAADKKADAADKKAKDAEKKDENSDTDNKTTEPFYARLATSFCHMNTVPATAILLIGTTAATVVAQDNIDIENETANKTLTSFWANLRGATLTGVVNAFARGRFLNEHTSGWPVMAAHLVIGMAKDAVLTATASDEDDSAVDQDDENEPNYVGLVAGWAATCAAAHGVVWACQHFTAPAAAPTPAPTPAPAAA